MNGGHEWGEAIMSMLVPGIVMYVAAMVGAAGWWLVRGLRERETDEGERNG